ncbi:PEP-CTERM system histidine kinase PrsK [Marinobacter daepoensis]|uniref:histidine kinase n=1 Tax=Marinobacter daepoensis TaxID=262077 RepID=A0ABS3BDC6_9GAMM|nr:XrtA/PEP-CTERM system histidine kinase PrsK [Marinobacter daepoensis]MBN7768891.1 PEP-CTERM system histidine kinase PrsK [Marinobacter daepoensis]MBY6077581.1 PEP-CTERM system histidine kinase PrsK [Marinobacter daepoensis]
MFRDLSVISHGAAAAVFAVLAVLVATRYLRRDIDRALFLAATVTTLWASVMVAQSLWGQPGFFIRYLLELLRDTAWILLLFAMLRDGFRQGRFTSQVKMVLGASTAILIVTLLALGTLEFALEIDLVSGKTKVIGQIALSLLGLSLVEQIWRNSPAFGRSSMKYLCIGIATLFAFDFFMYADALLFGQVADSFWNARGFVNAALMPLFAINVINTRKQPVDFRLSRSAVFHAGTLIFAGGYLLLLAVGGYYVRALGGEWGEALQVLFITVCLAFLLTLLLSRRIRGRLMVFISQNFFDYKYDYREEWLKLTKELADLSHEPPLPERVARILAGLVESNAGALWIKGEQKDFHLQASVNIATSRYTIIDEHSDLVSFFREKEWIIDLNEYREDPLSYNLLEIPDAITNTPEAWLIIPLYLDKELYGIAMVGEPYAKVELNWENFDLIKVVARQTCNLIAQNDAQNRLSRAMQFEAVSKASAFMVHDLKTLIAQLSLLVKNAPRHRNNPAFIDDMIATTDHAVRKMANLVDHIRKPSSETAEQRAAINLTELVRALIEDNSRRSPAPILLGEPPEISVCADKEQLRSVLGHLINNAQDATPPAGEITLNLKTARGSVVLFIQDTGSGMTEDFISTRLFKPFESTKGLTGMGIGAYQAREYIQELGGSIDVTSEPGLGSCFSVRIPLANPGTKVPETVFPKTSETDIDENKRAVN